MKPQLPSVRSAILTTLEAQPGLTPVELSVRVDATAADVRYHLSALLREGKVERVSAPRVRQAGRGRPARGYRVASATMPDLLPELAGALIDLIAPAADPPWAEIAARLAPPAPSAPLLYRIQTAVDQLDRMGYHPAWEARPRGPRILLRKCPFARLWANHPSICALDQAILERLSGVPFQQSAKLMEGESSCIFSKL